MKDLISETKSQILFIAHDLKYSFRLVIGRMLSILSRRRFVPIILRRLFLVLSLKHFSFFPERNILPFLDIDPQKVFLDVGANWGVYTLLMAPNCRHVYAWEPSPKAFLQLLKNSQRYGNITVFQEALGDVETTVELYQHVYSGHDSLIEKGLDLTGEIVEVQVRRLDDYDFQEGIGLIKIDTEGYELPVIKGGLRTIQTHKPRLIVEVHEPYEANAERIMKLLPSYSWKRRRKAPQSLNVRTFHLIGDPKLAKPRNSLGCGQGLTCLY